MMRALGPRQRGGLLVLVILVVLGMVAKNTVWREETAIKVTRTKLTSEEKEFLRTKVNPSGNVVKVRMNSSHNSKCTFRAPLQNRCNKIVMVTNIGN